MHARLQVAPSNLNRLKAVLQTIRDINDARLDSDQKLEIISECHRLLRLHKLDISPSEKDEAQAAETAWRDLLKEARLTERGLARIKRKFTYITKREVVKFAKDVREFHKMFTESGPGAAGNDLEKGLELLKVSVVTQTRCNKRVSG